MQTADGASKWVSFPNFIQNHKPNGQYKNHREKQRFPKN